MHVIAISTLRKFWSVAGRDDAEQPLKKWHKVVSEAEWSSFADVKKTFATASLVENFVVFNIGGNKYRLVVLISYPDKKVFVRHIMTHDEYDRDDWKKDDWFKAKGTKKKGKRAP